MQKKWLFAAALCIALFVMIGACAEVRINEVMLSTATFENGEAYEWLELHNSGDTAQTLNGMTLCYTRKDQTQTYTFSAAQTLKAGAYAVVFFTGNDTVADTKTAFYAPIDVSKKGGTITLYDANGQKLDEMTLDEQWGDISFGRVADGETLQFFETPTRGEKNPSIGYDERTRAVIFSATGGFFDSAFSLTASSETGAVIRYTLDGKMPTEQSPIWSGGLQLKSGVNVVRARAFIAGKLPSETKTQTYFVGVSRAVPVVSLTTDEKYLFDNKTGLLVSGSGKTANYYKDWEYPINVEYYNADNTQEINQMATFRVTGATSRKYGQKAISLFARSALGDKMFYFNPFENREGYEGYKALTLRAGGTESFKTRFKDAMMVKLANGMDIFYQESVTCVVYLNGAYWGQYNLRERINKHSLAAFEGITDEKTIDGVTIIKGRGEVSQGTIDEWNALIKFMKKNSLKDEDNLNYVLEQFDVDSYFTMVAFEIISGNGDIGNQRMYKFPGGKWKAVLYDLDAAMQNTKRTPLNYFLKSLTASNSLFYHEPFAALMKNDQMKDKFLTICGKILSEKFIYADLSAQIDQWVATLEPLMEEQIARWPKCSPSSLGTWKYEVNAFRKIARTRPKAVVNYLVKQYKLTKEQKEYYFGAFLAKQD